MSGRLLGAVCAVALSLALGGCGFHALYADYGPDRNSQQIFHTIYVEPIDGEVAGYEMRNALIDLLHGVNRPEDAQYRLTISIRQLVQSIAIENNASITRYNYSLYANYELTDRKTGKSILKGSENTISPYDVVASPYATEVAEHGAQKSGAHDIASRIQVRLAVYFTDNAPRK
ncbi:MAG: LPS assembly lipoprotein LptE [Rhizomicrobium sp.]|jgi:LPS-assembly lipoprotein